MKNQEYNGWTNYETWVIGLWIDNSEGNLDYWHARADEIWEEAKPDSYSSRKDVTIRTLADALKESHEEALPELSGFATDMMNAAMSEVNWHEVATHVLGDLADEEPTL